MIIVTMSDLQKTRDELALADQHLAEAEGRVSEQIILIEQMTEKGRDPTLAKLLLRSLEQARQEGHVRRQLILDVIARG
jgi:predicted transcriptional regulator